jgi:hypothetical protein
MDLRCFLLVSICVVSAACQRDAPAQSPVVAPQVQLAPSPTKTVRRIENPRYRLFKTQNIFNLLLLDTRTGQLWQVQYTIDEKKSPRTIFDIAAEIVPEGDDDGRFSLTMTGNMWTSILVDTKDGRVWQCQFGATDDDRFCIAIKHPKEGD